jgi:hypothetical protein
LDAHTSMIVEATAVAAATAAGGVIRVRESVDGGRACDERRERQQSERCRGRCRYEGARGRHRAGKQVPALAAQ